ncbi:hypothetical protein [Marmoricola sp. URHB0036]|uniref:hypothetical protein n=1 Tax=Marmoricola sp. URHB0036 TaxID=1298863 RepID=UPI0003FC1AED|nr:hypothetical protein [Marmoricola sp. URHB0036]
MTSYVARAVPWTRVALAAGLVVVLMELVRWNPWVLWPLEGTAVGLLAGATAWCFDETSAAVVDSAPRGLAWRTMARSPGALLLLVTWTAVVLHAGAQTMFGHRDEIWLQGVAACLAGAAYTGWRRSLGEASPGLRFATAVVPATTAWALLRPLGHHVSAFPYATTTPAGWEHSTLAWAALAGAALVVLGLVLADARWWRLRLVQL